MKTIKKIMVALDISEYSKEVLDYAGSLAESTRSELIIVNVINHRDIETLQKAAMETSGFSVKNWLEKQKKERLEAIQGLIRETALSHLPVKTLLREGIPFRELTKAVEEEAADLIVMGVKGRSNVPGVLVGSTADKVFRRCPVPLLNVRSSGQTQTMADR